MPQQELDAETSHCQNWTASVAHVAIECIDAKLTFSLGGGRGATSTPECSLDFSCFDALGEELAYCRAVFMKRIPCAARVVWLGRTSSRPAAEKVRGWRCVAAPLQANSSGGRSGPRQGCVNWLTVSEALLGLVAAVLQLFGAESFDLDVMDDGSGRLVQWYTNLGFTEAPPPAAPSSTRKSKGNWMSAPLSLIAQQLAPTTWLHALVPEQFDASSWLKQQATNLWLERARVGPLPRWSWFVAYPPRAQLHIEVSKNSTSTDVGTSLRLEASLQCAKDLKSLPSELVHCQCVLHLNQSSLEVAWLGRKNRQPSQARIRGVKAYPVSSTPSVDGSDFKVTCAMALLGALATVACWFGVGRVYMQSLDTGSGKLVRHLHEIGFEESNVCLADAGTSEIPELHIDCAALAKNACPTKWYIKLLEAEDLNRFHTLNLNRDHLLLEDAKRCKDSALRSDVEDSKMPQFYGRRFVLRDKMQQDREQFTVKSLPDTSDTPVRKLMRASSDPTLVRSGPLRNILHSRSKFRLGPLLK